MTEREIIKAIDDVLTGRAEELVLYKGGREDFTLYEREIGNYELRQVGASRWALQAEGLPYPVWFDEAKAR